MRKAFKTLVPESALAEPSRAPLEIMRSLVVRANFVPSLRHRLGWLGVRECIHGTGGWTLRIQGRPGVYGLSPKPRPHSRDTGPTARQSFSLSYFPHPEEDAVEQFSMRAGLAANTPEYMDAVREFTRSPEMGSLFLLGEVDIAVDADSPALGMTMKAETRRVTVAMDGIVLDTPKGPLRALDQGKTDQDLPALELALDFFRVLAASATHCLNRGPSALDRRQRDGRVIHFQSQGNAWADPAPDSPEVRLSMAWGDAPSPTIQKLAAPAPGAEFSWPRKDLCWTADQPKPGDYEDEQWWEPLAGGGSKSIDRRTLGITDRPRLIVLTGFLGSGKTSFLSRFIEHQTAKNSFVAVIQNEIGKKGLDGRLLGQEYAVTEMDEGCVCCTLAGNLRSALSDIMSRFQPDVCVLETTGLANPANLLDEISELEDLAEFESVTCVMDAEQAPGQLEEFEVARSQVRLADAIIVNKIDLVDEGHLEAVRGLIRDLNPVAPIHQAEHGDLPPGLVYGINMHRDDRPRPAAPALPTMAKAMAHTHEKDGLGSIMLVPNSAPAREEFLGWAESLPAEVLRAKGIIEFDDGQGPQIFQYVPGRAVMEPAGKADRGDRFLVIIGRQAASHAPAGFSSA